MLDGMTVFVIFIFVFGITLWTSLIWWAIRNIKNYRKTKKFTPQLFISVVLLAWFSFVNINSVLGWVI